MECSDHKWNMRRPLSGVAHERITAPVIAAVKLAPPPLLDERLVFLVSTDTTERIARVLALRARAGLPVSKGGLLRDALIRYLDAEEHLPIPS